MVVIFEGTPDRKCIEGKIDFIDMQSTKSPPRAPLNLRNSA